MIIPPAVRSALFVGLYLFLLQLQFVSGAPFFSVPIPLPVGTNPVAVVAVDLNSDGAMDLVVAHDAKDLLTLTNNGLGQFDRAATVSLAAPSRTLAVAEANGDTQPDIIATHSTPSMGFSVLTNNGGSGLAFTSTLAGNPSGVAFADLDGDGWTELIAADGRYLEVLTNDHRGQFTIAASLFSGFYPYRVVAADFNGDRLPDLVGGNFESVPTLVTNSGGGVMTNAHYLPWVVRPDFLKAADVNNDASTDLIVASATQLVALTNNGVGQFTPVRTNNITCTALEVADLDGDGAVDLVVADQFKNRLTVLTNNSHGRFTATAPLMTGQYPVDITVADVNGDRRPDLITANQLDDTLSVLLNYSRLALTIERTATNTAVLSWPLVQPFWHLETTTDLAPEPPLWGTVPPPFVTNGLTVQATFTVPFGQLYFRLRH